jgi:hypothetical protein
MRLSTSPAVLGTPMTATARALACTQPESVSAVTKTVSNDEYTTLGSIAITAAPCFRCSSTPFTRNHIHITLTTSTDAQFAFPPTVTSRDLQHTNQSTALAKYTTESSFLLLPLLGNWSFHVISLHPGTGKFAHFGHDGGTGSIRFCEAIFTV